MLFHFLKRQGFHLISQALKNELLPSGDMEPLYFYLTFFIRGSEKIRFGILQDYGSSASISHSSLSMMIWPFSSVIRKVNESCWAVPD